MFSSLSSDQIAEAARQAQAFLIVFDRERRVVWVNRFAHGYGADSVIGQRTEEDIHPDDRQEWLHNFRNCLDMGSTSAGEVRLLRSKTRVSYRMGPLRNEFGKIMGVVVASQDTTLSKQENPLLRFLLSPTSQQIVNYLRERGSPVKGATIGHRLGEQTSGGQASTRVRTLLNNLEARHIIRHTTDGYCLTDDFQAVYYGPES